MKPAVVSIYHPVPTDHKDLLRLTFLSQFIPVTQSPKPAGIHWSIPAEQNRKTGELNEDPHHSPLFSSVNQSPSVIPSTATEHQLQPPTLPPAHISCGSQRPSQANLLLPTHQFIPGSHSRRHHLQILSSLCSPRSNTHLISSSSTEYLCQPSLPACSYLL